MTWGQLPMYIPYTKINSKQIKDPNMATKTIKIVKENMRPIQ